MDLNTLKAILIKLTGIYQNAILEAESNSNYVLVGEIKKGDFYAKYRSLDDIRQLINNTQRDIEVLEQKENYKKYGCQVHNMRCN